MNGLGDRKGLSLVELLITMVVAALVVGATYQILTTNQRVHTTQQEQVRVQGSVRASLDVLSSELRGISIAEGDLVTMEEDRIEARVPRARGFVCASEEGGDLDERDITLRLTGAPFEEDFAVALFARHPDEGELAWVEGRIQQAQEPQEPELCEPGAEEQEIRVVGEMVGNLLGGGELRVFAGHPAHMLETFEYGLFEFDGESYLGRRDVDEGGTEHRLAGPLRPEDGVRFQYLAADGTGASAPEDVARIRATVRAQSGATGPDGEPVADSATVTIQPRN